MPMQSRPFFRSGDVVAHVDRNGISPVGLDQRGRERSVDEKSTFVDSIGSDDASSDIEIVRGPTSCNRVQILSNLLEG